MFDRIKEEYEKEKEEEAAAEAEKKRANWQRMGIWLQSPTKRVHLN